MRNEKKHLARFVVFCGLLSGALQLSLAAEMTFNVPLKITNFPSSNTLSVNCSMQKLDGSTHNETRPIPLTNGNFSGSISVFINKLPPEGIDFSKGWNCYLFEKNIDASVLAKLKDPNKPATWAVSGKF